MAVVESRTRGPAAAESGTPPVRVLMVSRMRYTLPLAPAVLRKFDAVIANGVDLRVLASTNERAPGADPVFRLVPARSPRIVDGPLFYLGLPRAIATELRDFEPEMILVQGVHECAAALLARALTRAPAKVVLDVQGNWRAATRLYGSRARRMLNPLNDALGRFAITHADGVRTVGAYTAALVRELGVEPVASFPTYVDRASVVALPPRPLPKRPQVLFIGVLERYKGIDTLLEAWPQVVAELRDARLTIVGTGKGARSVAAAIRDPSLRVRWTPSLSSEEIVHTLDESTVLVLPSRMEGMGRVIIEAFARARPVVGARAGGIVDIVEDERNGLLVEPEDAAQLAAALVRVLGDEALAQRLGAAALQSTESWLLEPEEWADRFVELARTVTRVRSAA
jgi:glycosyltransferase involved in cell wall biosynthesis